MWSWFTRGNPPRTWTIGGRIFVLREPVLLQLQQFGRLMREHGVTDAEALQRVAEDAMPEVLAVVLVEQGADVATRDLDEVAAHMRGHVNAQTAAEVLDAFFHWPGLPRQMAAAGAGALMLGMAMDGQTSKAPSETP